MAALHPDPAFDRQLRRGLAVASRGTSDIDEVMSVVGRVFAGDVAGWEREWQRIADRTLATGDELLGADDLDGACRAFLRAAEYYRQAGIFSSDRAWLDESRHTLDAAHVNAFRAAMPLLPVPAEIVDIDGAADNGESTCLRGYLFRLPGDPDRPLALAIVGPGSTAEAGYAEVAMPVLDRGMNCLVLAAGHVRQGWASADWRRALQAAARWIAERPDLDGAPLVLLTGSDPLGDELAGVAESQPFTAGPVPLELTDVQPRT